MQARTRHLLIEAARLYPFDESTLRLISSTQFSPNDIYSFTRDGRAYILRIATHAEDHAQMTAAEMAFLAHLHGEGVPVSMPLPMRDGGLVRSLRSGAHHHAVCAFEKAEGIPFDRDNPAAWNGRVCRDWGHALGLMHRAAQTYRPASGLARPVFDGSDALSESLRALPALFADAKALVASLLALPRGREAYGLIHGDLHQKNFFVHDDRVHAFDFDDCLYGYFALDIGVSLYFALLWGLPDAERARQRAAEQTVSQFLAGYAAANALEETARRAILPFMRFRQLSDFAWEYDPATAPLDKARERLSRGVIIPGVQLPEALFL